MKIVKILLTIIALLAINAAAKPTFDVVADIMHDLLHEPYHPSHGPSSPYVHDAAYTYNGYNGPDHAQGGYDYNRRPQHVNTGVFYPNNSPNIYYPKNPNGEYYAPNGAGNYGPNGVYDNQGYYKGPPYYNNQPNGYNYNNAPHGYGHNGY